jgi:hypothetical protein
VNPGNQECGRGGCRRSTTRKENDMNRGFDPAKMFRPMLALLVAAPMLAATPARADQECASGYQKAVELHKKVHPYAVKALCTYLGVYGLPPDQCAKGAGKIDELNKKAFDAYNKAVPGSAQIGPRQLGPKQSGKILAPGGRMFVSTYLLTDTATVNLKKLDGKADVNVKACVYDGDKQTRIGSGKLAGSNKSASYHQTFTGLRGKVFSIELTGAGLLKTMKYDLTFDTKD